MNGLSILASYSFVFQDVGLTYYSNLPTDASNFSAKCYTLLLHITQTLKCMNKINADKFLGNFRLHVMFISP